MENKESNKKNKKNPKENILSVVKEFISYFEEVDRRKEDGNRIKRS